MSNFVGASLRDIATIIDNANASERDALVTDAVATLNERLAKAKPDSGKAKRTMAFIAQLTEGKPLDHKAAFAAAKARKPKASPKPKTKVATQPAAANLAGMSDADLAGMVAMLTTELAKRNA